MNYYFIRAMDGPVYYINHSTVPIGRVQTQNTSFEHRNGRLKKRTSHLFPEQRMPIPQNASQSIDTKNNASSFFISKET